MKYSVKVYLAGNKKSVLYQNVTGDFILENIYPNNPPADIAKRQSRKIEIIPVRVIELEDKTRVEIPMNMAIIEFSKERFFGIHKNMEAEAGQTIPIKK